jgi:multicomponent Na+:H+ antiporter subunit E
MRPFAWNLLLAILWVGLSGQVSTASFALGFVVSALLLITMGRALGVYGYGGELMRLLGFVAYYLKELIISNLRVARDIMRPRMQTRPAIVAIPLDDLSAPQVTLLANLITMTPGTLSLDVTEDRSTLFVHAMFMSDADQLRREIKTGLERRVKGVIK